MKWKINFKSLSERNLISQDDAIGNSRNWEKSGRGGGAQSEPFENELNKMARRENDRSTPARFIVKFWGGATMAFVQVSKYYLTCETSTESTNNLRQTKNRCCSPEMTVAFLYLVDLKPLTIIILPLCLVTVPRPGVFTASSVRALSLSRSLSKGTAHRSCQIMFTLLFHDVIALTMH